MQPGLVKMDRRRFLNQTLRTAGAAATITASVATNFAAPSKAAAQALALPPVSQPPLSGFWAQRYLSIPGGTPVPDMQFNDANGRWLNLQAFYGRPTVVVFWATWCSACLIDMPGLNRVLSSTDPQRLAVVPISIDSLPLAQVGRFLSARGWHNLSHFQDQSRVLFNAFGSGATPTAFLIDRHNRVIGGLRGAAHWETPESRAVLQHMQNA